MTATNEEINQTVDEFVQAIADVGLMKVMPPRERGNIIDIGPIVKVGGKYILSKPVLFSMAEKIRNTFLEEYPARVNSFFHAINYEACMNCGWGYETAILNREIWDSEFKLSTLAAESAMAVKGKNDEVERDLWGQFL
jgi:hypothetical protein